MKTLPNPMKLEAIWAYCWRRAHKAAPSSKARSRWFDLFDLCDGMRDLY